MKMCLKIIFIMCFIVAITVCAVAAERTLQLDVPGCRE